MILIQDGGLAGILSANHWSVGANQCLWSHLSSCPCDVTHNWSILIGPTEQWLEAINIPDLAIMDKVKNNGLGASRWSWAKLNYYYWLPSFCPGPSTQSFSVSGISVSNPHLTHVCQLFQLHGLSSSNKETGKDFFALPNETGGDFFRLKKRRARSFFWEKKDGASTFFGKKKDGASTFFDPKKIWKPGPISP